MDKTREKKSKFTEDIENEPNQFVCSALFKRQSGFNIPGRVLVKLEEAAEDSLISEQRNFKESKCELPGICRSTFLMVYSPDGTKVASTHGNHNVYVTDLKTGKNLNTLSGHPRTPWCIAFHPTSNQILATGCLGGQVRVWDLHGGSEVWVTKGHTVIASLAFHPTDRMLVIATYNELHFWDWSEATPFTKCYTANEKEKVRYVSFDSLGHKLITGISNAPPNHTQWDRLVAPTPHHTHLPYRNTHRFSGPERDSDRRSISGCYRSLVDQYEMLVQRYSELSRSLPAATMDRGTDPMDVDAESQFSDFHHRTHSRHSRSRRPPRTRLTRPSTSRERGSNGSLPLIMLQYLRRAHQRLEETRDNEGPNYSGTLPAPPFTHSRIRNHSRQSYPPIRSINLDLPNYYNYSEPSHPCSTHNESYQNTNLQHFQELQRFVNTNIPNPPPSYDIPIHRGLPNRPSLMTPFVSLSNPTLPSRGSNSESNQSSVIPESTLCTCNLESSRSGSNPHSTTCDATSNPTPNLPSTTCDTNSRWWSNRINHYNLAEQRARFHASMEELQPFSIETSTSQNSSEPLLVHSNYQSPRNPYHLRRETQDYLGTSNSDRPNSPDLRTRTREERELFGRNLESLLETTGYRETRLGHDTLPTRITNNMSTRDIHDLQNATVFPNRSTNVRLGRTNNTSLHGENNPSSRLRPGTSLTQDSNFESESPIMLPPNQTMTITTKPRGSRCVQLSNQTLQPTTSREDNTQIGLSASLNNVVTTSEQTSSQNHTTNNTSCSADGKVKLAYDKIINVRNAHSKLLSSLKVSVELRKRLNEILSPLPSENAERSSNSSSVANQSISNESVLLGQATSRGTQNINSLATDPNKMSQGGTNSGDSNNDSKSNEYRRLAAFKRKLNDILSPSNNETPASHMVDTSSTLVLVNNEVGSVGNESVTNATLVDTVEDGTDTRHRSTDNLTERDALDLSTTATTIPSVMTTPDESALNIITNTNDVLPQENPRTQSNTITTQTSPTTNNICIQVSTLTPSCSTASSPGSFSVSQRSAFQPPTFQSRVNVSTETPPRPSTRPGEEDGVRYGIQLLSRHIDNMQRLCRARLEILQLQQIRRMWEDLQRQIQSLDVAVNVDQQGNNAHIPSVSQMLELARISDTEENPLPGPSQQQQSTPDNSQLVNCKNKFLLELIKKMIPEAVIPEMSSSGNDSSAVPVSASGHSVVGSDQELSCKGDGVFPSTSTDVSASKKMKIDGTSQGEDLSVSVCNIVNSESESPCPDPGITTDARSVSVCNIANSESESPCPDARSVSVCNIVNSESESPCPDARSVSVCNIVNSESESPCPDPGITTDASECKKMKTDQMSEGEYVQPTGSNSDDVFVARESKFKNILESKLKEYLEMQTRAPLDLTMEYQAPNNVNVISEEKTAILAPSQGHTLETIRSSEQVDLCNSNNINFENQGEEHSVLNPMERLTPQSDVTGCSDESNRLQQIYECVKNNSTFVPGDSVLDLFSKLKTHSLVTTEDVSEVSSSEKTNLFLPTCDPNHSEVSSLPSTSGINNTEPCIKVDINTNMGSSSTNTESTESSLMSGTTTHSDNNNCKCFKKNKRGFDINFKKDKELFNLSHTQIADVSNSSVTSEELNDASKNTKTSTNVQCNSGNHKNKRDLTFKTQTNSNPSRSVKIAKSSNKTCPVHAENIRQIVFPRSPQSTALLHQLQQRVHARRQRVFNRRLRRRVLRYGEIGCHGSRATSVLYRHQDSGHPLNQHSHRSSSLRVIMSRPMRLYNPSQHRRVTDNPQNLSTQNLGSSEVPPTLVNRGSSSTFTSTTNTQSVSASSSGGSRRNSAPEFRGSKRKLPRTTAKETKSSSTFQSSTRTSQPAEDASRHQEPSDPTETIRAMIVRLEELVRQQREQRASLMRELMRSNRGSSRQRSSEMWELRERTPWLRGEVNSESDSDSNPDIESQLSTLMNWNDDAMRRLGNTLGLGRGSSSPGTAAGTSRMSDETQGNATSAGLDETRRSWDQTRESTQRQAREVLSLMVGSLTEFFRNHNVADQSTHTVLEEQICNLYVLLHLALELTDLLLAQLVYTRRELEQQWVHNRLRTPPASLDRSTSNSSSFSRSNNRRVPQCPFTSPPPPRTIPIIYQQLVLLRQQRQGGERRRPRVSRGPSPLPAAIPVLQVNDLPVPDTPPSNQPTFPRLSRPLSPSPHPFGFASHPDLSWDPHGFHGFHVWRPRNLHHFMSDFVTDTPEDATPGPGLTIRGASAGQEAMYLGETALIQSHRIQVWDFSKFKIPKIGNVKENIVVAECKIHNDASVDVSRDNKILVALLPNGRYNSTTMLGVYSLEWSSLGQCLYMTSFEQNAVSVSLSPTNRHLLVGLATRRMVPSDHTIIAQIFYLDGAHPIPNKEVGIKGRLRHARNIEQCRNHSSLSVNCIRWLPTPGQGFVYGTNSGFLRILR